MVVVAEPLVEVALLDVVLVAVIMIELAVVVGVSASMVAAL